MSNLKLYSVNWQDGMLLNEQHLSDQERYLEDLSRWYAMPGGDAYGLVRAGSIDAPALSLNLSVNGDRLRVQVDRCRAITSDGHVIDINESSADSVGATMHLADGDIPVYISVNPGQKNPTGAPDTTEEVPRLPYRASAYTVHLGERPNAPEGQVLQLALLVVAGSEVAHSARYMPPCVTLAADERLSQKAGDLRNGLESLLSVGNRAFAAMLAGEKTDLQASLRDCVYRFVAYLSSSVDEFVVGRNAGHPLSLVIFYRRLFRVFHTLLNLHPGVRDYVHEKYFIKEASTDVSRFMSLIDGFLLARYNHEDIGGHIQAIEGITDHIRGLLGFLAHVKGEQLGPQAVQTDSISYSGKTYMVADYTRVDVEQVGDLVYVQVNLSDPAPMKDTVILLAKSIFDLQDWSAMHVRLGLNDARGLGETDPVAVDATTYGDKVALHPHDMLQTQSVRRLTMIFRGVPDVQGFNQLGKMDLFVYAQ